MLSCVELSSLLFSVKDMINFLAFGVLAVLDLLLQLLHQVDALVELAEPSDELIPIFIIVIC